MRISTGSRRDLNLKRSGRGSVVLHINNPERKVRARKLFSSRSKQNIPLRGEISSNIWLHYRPLSSLHSLQKLIRQREQMRGKSEGREGRTQDRAPDFFFSLASNTRPTFSLNLFRYISEASYKLQGNR